MKPPHANLRVIGNSEEPGEVPDEEKGDPVEIQTTDLGNTRCFVDQHRGNIHFVPCMDWTVFDGQKWQPNAENRAVELAKSTVKRIRVGAMNHKQPTYETEDGRNSIYQWARRSQSRPRIQAMLELAKSDPDIWSCAQKFDQDPFLLNVRNGTLNLRTGTFRAHSKRDFITKQMDIAFDSSATAPRFEKFMSEVFPGDNDLQSFVQRCVGYSLTGDVSEQVFFLCAGDGANGKTVLLETLQALVGSYGLNVRAETLMAAQNSQQSNGIARLAGSRVATVSEIEYGHRLNESLLKDITGGDLVTARYLYKEEFDFHPQAKIWMRGNYLPDIRGRDHGIWRRVLIIPFSQRFSPEDRDPDLLKSLAKEFPGILNWAIAGCLSWQKTGLRPPCAVLDAVTGHRNEMDSITKFLNACTVKTDEPKTKSMVLFQAYKKWCLRENIPGINTIKAFGSEMKKYHGDLRKEKAQGVYFRLQLVSKDGGGCV